MSQMRKVVEYWALAGGALLVAVVLITAASAFANIFLNAPIPGDFEITEIAVAIAAFSFLPYCQLTSANVCADLFTAKLGPRVQSALSLLACAVAALFAAVLLWRMSAGMLDYRADQEITHILGFPVWLAFPPMLISLVLLLATAAATAYQAWLGMLGKKSSLETSA